jgi:predicted N-acetyltransferase YhbS
VRGLNRVVNANGEVVATVRFTDVFVYRERRWQAVAGQETMVTEKK